MKINKFKLYKPSKEFDWHKIILIQKGTCLLLLAANLTLATLLWQFDGVSAIKKVDKNNLFANNKIAISSIEQEKIIDNLEQELNVEIKNNKDKYLLLNAIYNNRYLSFEEKKLFYRFIDYFNDNPYLDKQAVYERLLNVDIHFSWRSLFKVSSNTLASYRDDYNTIVYYDFNPEDETLAHEGGHCINGDNNLPRWFNEGMTQLIINEYFYDNPFEYNGHYPNEVYLVKYFCEILGSDTMLEAYTKDEPEIIYKKLGAIYGNSKCAKTKLDIIDNYMDKILNAGSDDELHHNFKELSEEGIKEVIYAYSYLANYAKAGNKEEKDTVIYLYFQLTNPIFEEGTDEVLKKAYLSSELKNKGYDKGNIKVKEKHIKKIEN